jgi:hypothetical protein
MKFLMTKRSTPLDDDDRIPPSQWERVEVPGVRTHHEAAICLANEPGFFAPWGGRVWLYLAIDSPDNAHHTGGPKTVRALECVATPARAT